MNSLQTSTNTRAIILILKQVCPVCRAVCHTDCPALPAAFVNIRQAHRSFPIAPPSHFIALFGFEFWCEYWKCLASPWTRDLSQWPLLLTCSNTLPFLSTALCFWSLWYWQYFPIGPRMRKTAQTVKIDPSSAHSALTGRIQQTAWASTNWILSLFKAPTFTSALPILWVSSKPHSFPIHISHSPLSLTVHSFIQNTY